MPATPSRCALTSAPRICSAVIGRRRARSAQCSASASRSSPSSSSFGSAAGSGASRSNRWPIMPRPRSLGRPRAGCVHPASRRRGRRRRARQRLAGPPRRRGSHRSSIRVQAPGSCSRSRSTIRPRSQRLSPRIVATARWPPHAGTRCRRPPPDAEAHNATSGQSEQRGERGRQSVAPRSMTACVQRSGASGSISSSASACASRGSGRPYRRSTTRRTFVSTAATGIPKQMAATARAVYAPIPGSSSSSSSRRGTRPP